MPTHFLGLTGAAVLATHQYQAAERIINDLVDHSALGVMHGPAGAGKTFAVDSHLEALRARTDVSVVTCSMAFPSRPTMLQVAIELTTAITGITPKGSPRRFPLINNLIGSLGGNRRLVVIDEAQRLNSDCLEMIRHIHDHKLTSFALLYVGGDGCWEVLSREPMLRSRVFRRLPFTPLDRSQIPALMRGYHHIYTEAEDALLMDVDDVYARGNLRDWAVFTHTAASLAAATGREHLDAAIVANCYALLGGGV